MFLHHHLPVYYHHLPIIITYLPTIIYHHLPIIIIIYYHHLALGEKQVQSTAAVPYSNRYCVKEIRLLGYSGDSYVGAVLMLSKWDVLQLLWYIGDEFEELQKTVVVQRIRHQLGEMVI